MRSYDISTYPPGYPHTVREVIKLAEDFGWTDEEIDSVIDLQVDQSVKILDHTILRTQ